MTTYQEDIEQLLLPIISANSETTPALEDQLRLLLGKKIKDPRDMIQCLLDIVRKRSKKTRIHQLPYSVIRQISRILDIGDARNLLEAMEQTFPEKQRKDQLKMRQEARKKQTREKYQKLIADGKYLSWYDLLCEKSKRGVPLRQLRPFITAQNIPNEHLRSRTWNRLLEEAYRRGMPFDQLRPFITEQNIPVDYMRWQTWRYLLSGESERGMPIDQLRPFMTRQNIPHEMERSWTWLTCIMIAYKRGVPFDQLRPFITAQNIPDEITRSVIWSDLLYKEAERGVRFDQLRPFITAQNIPDEITRSFIKKKCR